MYAFLRSPRWISLLVVAALMAFLFLQLAAWQQRRLDDRQARNSQLEHSLEQPAVPLAELVSMERSLADGDDYREARVAGTWDPSAEFLIRNRPHKGAIGFLVVTPFRPESGPALLIERGWVPAGESASVVPDVPAPRAGSTTAVVRIRPLEPAKRASDLPAGQRLRIDADAVAALPYPAVPAYGELVSSEPADSNAMPLPEPPEPTDGPHLAYSIEWVLFTVIGVIGVIVLLRREAQFRATDGTQPQATGSTEAPDHAA